MPVELFQILKDEAVKLLHSICQQFRNPNPETEPASPVFLALAGRCFTTEPPGKPRHLGNISAKVQKHSKFILTGR